MVDVTIMYALNVGVVCHYFELLARKRRGNSLAPLFQG